MSELKELLVCAVCHAELPLEHIERAGTGSCPGCGQRYAYEQGVYSLAPQLPPNEMPEDKVGAWQTLQANGLVSYTTAPEFNLSVGLREDALAFKSFCRLSGLILDVGCGTQYLPSYLPEDGAVVGLDPFRGQQPRGFAFVRGLGEYLPFRDGTFDHILFATSLDHMINPRRALAEAERCLTPKGYLNLWLDAQAESHAGPAASSWGRYQLLAKKGFRSLARGGWIEKLGWWRTLSYIGAVARMKVPEGAVDYFHLDHLMLTEVRGWLDELGLRVAREEVFPASDGLFIQAQH
jgi:SAM-dependent methyltransferase